MNHRSRTSHWIIACAVFSFFLGAGCEPYRTVKKLLADDPKNRGEALGTLVQMTPKEQTRYVPPLIEKLKGPNLPQIQRTVDALTIIGEPAIPELTRALKNPDPLVRTSAAQTLGLIGDPAAPAIPDLIKLLKDSEPAVRGMAATALGYMGPAAKEAVPALRQTRWDTNSDVRRQVVTALENIRAKPADIPAQPTEPTESTK